MDIRDKNDDGQEEIATAEYKYANGNGGRPRFAPPGFGD
jgi:hypothetical protein